MIPLINCLFSIWSEALAIKSYHEGVDCAITSLPSSSLMMTTTGQTGTFITRPAQSVR
jgi:hypothetical protein